MLHDVSDACLRLVPPLKGATVSDLAGVLPDETVAEIVGVSRVSVLRYRRRHGIQVAPNATAGTAWLGLIRWWLEAQYEPVTAAQVAEAFHWPDPAVARRWLCRLEWRNLAIRLPDGRGSLWVAS